MEYLPLVTLVLELIVKLIGPEKTKALIDDLAAVQRANAEADELERAKFGS